MCQVALSANRSARGRLIGTHLKCGLFAKSGYSFGVV